MISRFAYFAVLLAGLLAAAPTAMTQTVPEAPLRLALKGYDPVAYFADGKPTPGKPEYEAVFDEVRYRFATAQHLEQFKSDPDRFAPQFAGSCAGSLAAGVKVEANPEYWRIVDDKLFVFASPVSTDRSPVSTAEMIAKARDNWKTLAKAPSR